MRFWMLLVPFAFAHFVHAAPPNDFPAYVEECKGPGLRKLRAMAEYQNVAVDESSFKVVEIDDRWYNPYKYVWFAIEVRGPNGEVQTLQVMTQKSFLPRQDCF